MTSVDKKTVLVLLGLLIAIAVCTSGCAGVAEPLPSLAVAPDNLTVSAKVGTASSLPATLTNTGNTPVSVSQAVLTGSGFSMTGLAMPLSLPAGQSASFSVKFAATKTGAVTGSVAFLTDPSHRPVMLPLHGNGSSTSPLVSSIAVSPLVASPAPSASVQFTAAVQGTTTNDAVTWSATIGAVTSAGMFTAPATAGIGKITATSVADSTKSATAIVTVATGSQASGSGVTSVTVTPATASSITSGTLPFTASVQGTTSNKAVIWKALLGTITAAGAYTAPAKAGADTVTATSAADTTKSASAKVTVTTASATPTVSSVLVSPASTSLAAGGALQFSAAVAGTATDKSVTWTASLGKITSSGAYTAPAKAGTDTVTATSDADSSKSASAAVTVTSPTSTPSSNNATCGGSGCPAFPGAEGSAAASAGGRGGVVLEVTNLNDSGNGSLRACIQASGPRTCVFRVSGLITNRSRLQVNNPYLTIAGQTAPGGGIVLGGPDQQGEALFISTHDVIVRYVTYNGNNPNTPTGPSTGTVGFELTSGNVYNVILDHVSARWWGDKGLLMMSNDGGPVHDDTLQWSLFYEPNATHPVGPMTDATSSPAIADTNLDFHHNMFANTSHRLPLFNAKSGRWASNLVFNWDYFAGLWQGATTPDIIGNKYVKGNMNVGDNGGHPHEFEFTSVQSTDDSSHSMGGAPSIFVSGNIGPNQPSASGNQQQLTAQVPGEGLGENGAVPSGWFRSSALQQQQFPIAADPAGNLDSILLPTVGNSQHLDCSGNFVSNRDPEDARIISQYQSNGNGSLFTGQFSQLSISLGTACTESLHDGIPDQWKTLKGLSTTDQTLYKSTAPNGYTYLENYLNGTDN
jgi:pectate lyase